MFATYIGGKRLFACFLCTLVVFFDYGEKER